jgi:hypothetical protein
VLAAAAGIIRYRGRRMIDWPARALYGPAPPGYVRLSEVMGLRQWPGSADLIAPSCHGSYRDEMEHSVITGGILAARAGCNASGSRVSFADSPILARLMRVIEEG